MPLLAVTRELVDLSAFTPIEDDLPACVLVDRVALSRPPALGLGREDAEGVLDDTVDGDCLAYGFDDERFVHDLSPFLSAAALKRARASSQNPSTQVRSATTPVWSSS